LASQGIKINKNNIIRFMVLITFLSFVLVVCFSVRNIILYYLLFEVSLIPIFLIILGWGYQPERLQAGVYLIFYTIRASLPLLIRILMAYKMVGRVSFVLRLNTWVDSSIVGLWWLIFIIAFIVKMPLYGVHLWLPKAHVEAPVAGSIILAAVLLKLGSYGLCRVLYLFVWPNSSLTSFFRSIALGGAVVTGFICVRQSDMKSLIAYSSVGHIGLLISGIISNTRWGLRGSLVLIVAHGLCSSALFALANISYEVTHTRRLFMVKGLVSLYPRMTGLWFLLSVFNMGAPPRINLLGEIMLIIRSLHISFYLIPFLGVIGFVRAVYSLVLYTSLHHGQPAFFINFIGLGNLRNKLVIMLHLLPLIVLRSFPDLYSL
jgi:NADH-ubiquinone oxidoreductase chain 4